MPIIKKRYDVEDEVVAELDGSIGSDNCRLLRDELDGLRHVGYTKILLDFSGVSFLASAGLGILIKLNQRLEQEPDGRLCLCSLNEQVQSVFNVAGVSEFFDIYPDVKKALASISEKKGKMETRSK